MLANFAQKILPIKRNSRQQRRGVNYLAHLAIGTGWGAAYGVAAHNGLRGQRAVAAVFATVYSGDVLLNTLLGLYKPRQWSTQDTIVDVIDKLVQAEDTAAIYDTAFARPKARSGSDVDVLATARHMRSSRARIAPRPPEEVPHGGQGRTSWTVRPPRAPNVMRVDAVAPQRSRRTGRAPTVRQLTEARRISDEQVLEALQRPSSGLSLQSPVRAEADRAALQDTLLRQRRRLRVRR